MRVLIATGIYPPEIGGPATYARILEEELPRRGIEVVVYPFRAVRHLPRAVRHGAYFLGVMRRASHADLILALDPVSVGFPSMLAARLLRKRFIVKIVGDYAWEQYMQGRVFLMPVRRRVERWVATSADRVIVPSEYLEKIVARWGVPRERITVVYNAFEPPAGAETREEVRAHLGLPYPALISVGRLVPWKGFGAVIDVMPRVVARYPNAKLYIIGDGPEYEKLKIQISKSNMDEHVVLLGSVPHDEVLHMMKGADVFVLNSGYEGLSHVLLETMSLGTPIVTTNAGGNAETVSERLRFYARGADDFTVIVPTASGRIRSLLEVRRRAIKMLRCKRVDVISTRDPYFLGFLAVRLARRFSVGLEVQVHGFERLSGVRKLLAHYVLRRADSIRVVSERLLRIVQGAFGVVPHRITVAPIYTDWEKLQRERPKFDLRARYPGKFIFLTIGRLVPIKNIGMQIEAMRAIGGGAILIVVGTGPERYERADNVIFVGETRDIASYYKTADCLLITSNYEGWGLVAVEAASVGLPIIMTDVGLAGDVITETPRTRIIPVGDAGALVREMRSVMTKRFPREPFGDVRARLLSKKETLTRIRSSWERAAHSIKNYYSRIPREKYGGAYERRRWFGTSLDRDRYEMMRKSIEHHVRGLQFQSCFELGPGPGTWTKVLMKHAPRARYTLLDISEEMRRQFDGSGNIEYIIGDFDMYKPGAQHDFFFSSRAFEYLRDKRAAVGKIAALLRPGGRAMIITKMPHYAKMRVLGQNAPWQHRGQIGARALGTLLSEAGFQNIEMHPAVIYVPVLGRIRSVNRLVWRILFRTRLTAFSSILSEAYMTLFST